MDLRPLTPHFLKYQRNVESTHHARWLGWMSRPATRLILLGTSSSKSGGTPSRCSSSRRPTIGASFSHAVVSRRRNTSSSMSYTSLDVLADRLFAALDKSKRVTIKD